jgi:hypothetical protein
LTSRQSRAARSKEFPLTKAEWAAVAEAALPVVNATLADDPVLRASHLEGLLEVLAGLRACHGDHPVLLETEADFAEEDAERIALYRRAAGIALAHGLPTLSIRLSLARALLDTGAPPAALAELSACENELGLGDASARESWANLVVEAGQAERGATRDNGSR